MRAMAEPRSYPRAIAVFILCQALTTTCAALVITTTALVGRMLAVDAGLATLPLAVQYLALMGTTRGAAWAMGRWGRRFGFSLGAACGVVGGTLATLAIAHQAFVLFAVGAAFVGTFLAFGMHYRFAAADTVPPARQSRVISWVMAGGVLAAVAGPQLANWARGLFAPIDFAGVYAVLAGLCALQLLVLQLVALPDPGTQAARGGEAPDDDVGRRPAGFVPAVVCGMVAYGGMNLVMAVTPPAMADCGLGFGAAAFVIQWHVFAMYAPSFVTGHLIQWLGLRAVLLAGVGLMALAVAINVVGVELANFAVGLVCLGVGWNLLFVGATTWLTRLQTAHTSTRLQGLNDVFVFGAVAATALSSGWVLESFGWTAVNLAILPALAAALIAILVDRTPSEAALARAS
jgi:MFS family permease